MWEEDSKWQEGHWRTVVVLLKVAVGFAALMSLGYGTWEPLVSVLVGLATVVGILFAAWVVPMWLLGKTLEQLARLTTRLRRGKSLKPGSN